MKMTAALAATPARTSIPANDPGGAESGSDGNFAATLDLAREPAKAAVERPAKFQASAAPAAAPAQAAAPKSPAKATPSATSERGGDAQDVTEETTTTAAPVATDPLFSMLGLPTLPLTPDAAVTPQPVGASGTQVGLGADLDPAVALTLDAAPPDPTVPVPGKSRATPRTLGGLMAQPAAPSASGFPASAEPTAEPTPAGAPALASLAVATSPPAKPAADALAPPTTAWPATAAPVAGAPTAGQTTASPAAAHPFSAHLAAAVESPGFAPALATQVSWLVQEGMQHARLTLNPADMGPVAVRIVVEGTQARVDFSAALAGTRAAIEASLPTLAAALHDNGLTLAGGGVSDGQARSGANGEQPRQSPGHAGPTGAPETGDGGPAMPPRAARGLVDLVA